MNRIKLDHWYLDENQLSISLMNFYVSIEICLDFNNMLYYKLNINDSKNNKLIIYFQTIEDAISFTEQIVANSLNLDEISNRYYLNFENNKIKTKTKSRN